MRTGIASLLAVMAPVSAFGFTIEYQPTVPGSLVDTPDYFQAPNPSNVTERIFSWATFGNPWEVQGPTGATYLWIPSSTGTGIWYGNHPYASQVNWQLGSTGDGNYMGMKMALDAASSGWHAYMYDYTNAVSWYWSARSFGYLTGEGVVVQRPIDNTVPHNYEYQLKNGMVNYTVDGTSYYDGAAYVAGGIKILIIGDGSAYGGGGFGAMKVYNTHIDTAPSGALPAYVPVNQLHPVSYAITNGTSAGYLDDTYTSGLAGVPNAPLTGGTGELTDGIHRKPGGSPGFYEPAVGWETGLTTIAFDLGSVKTLSSILLYTMMTENDLGDAVHPIYAELSYSSDGGVFVDGGGHLLPQEAGDDQEVEAYEMLLAPLTARYITMTLTRDRLLALSEVEFFGTTPVPEPATAGLLVAGVVSLLSQRRKERK